MRFEATASGVGTPTPLAAFVGCRLVARVESLTTALEHLRGDHHHLLGRPPPVDGAEGRPIMFVQAGVCTGHGTCEELIASNRTPASLRWLRLITAVTAQRAMTGAMTR